MLAYGVEVWGLLTNSKIEKVHTMQLIKRCLSVPLHSANKM